MKIVFPLTVAILLACTPAFGGTVYGNVTKNARPIATTLSFTDQDGKKESVTTNPAGRYELILPPGEYTITSSAGDVAPAAIAVFHEPQQQDILVQAPR